ncbi:hypothetical protein [Actinoplanes aureus]|uniref:Uncharacterized protein n=1 Tax=Actinoplanes aureus TaxID=2792083 RepID=A0A931CE48_9ACTN|nr:hypothetical protein [Actinoplanes aureus]MBG0565523.1 hypothetical protein [Actinoplanes aureus]
MSGEELSAAEQRVWARLPDGSREALLGLSPTDQQTLLLSVARARSSRVRPADLVRRWREDRFVRPAAAGPREITAVVARLWELLPAAVEGVELSPLAPVGACSALGPVSQNRVVTTMRSSELVSDATNALAIEAADRRLRQPGGGLVHLAASHRLVRAQRFVAGAPAHFRLFSLVSSGRDAGNGTTQARMLAMHVGFWQRALAALVPAASPQVHYTCFDDTAPPAPDAAHGVPVVEEPERERGRGYYTCAALRTTAAGAEIGDGGFTTWTALLMGDAKERCLISCVSVDELTARGPISR